MLRATCTIASILLLSVATHGADSLWEASSDLLPHEIEHPYTLVDDADPEEPALAGGVLTLATSEDAESASRCERAGRPASRRRSAP